MVQVAGRRLDRTASFTAQFNATQRAAETLRPESRRLVEDHHSRYFVTHPALRAVLASALSADAALRILDWRLGGLHAHIVLRVRYADDAFDAACAEGVDQIVLLGAGFDTTSLRRAHTTARIFEVDAPATQADKRPIVEQHLRAEHSCHPVWVPCDFEHDGLRDQLLRCDFDPSKPSLILWLGVTPYLTGAAIDATLSDLALLCAPASRVVIDYIRAGVVDAQTQWKSANRVASMVIRRGEPYRSDFTQADFDAKLRDHGFEPCEHLSVSALLRRYDPTNTSRLAGDDWLAVATAERTGN